MRIRLPFAGVFLVLCLIAGYAGLSSLQVDHIINDKVLHALTFFILTVVFYWVIDTSRRRNLNLTLAVCTLGLGVGSEFLQGFLPNGRNFDLNDILANIVGSLVALGICSWYHQRMLERKRQRRYSVVPGDEPDDLELGEGVGLSGQQEEGILATSTEQTRNKTLEEEVDNWDENAEDNWDEDDEPEGDIGVSGRALSGDDDESAKDKKKRAD